MARIKIDVWGRTSTEPNFNTQPLQEYETDAIDGSGDGVIYTRFSTGQLPVYTAPQLQQKTAEKA